ncbi:elongin A, like isoform X3 [Leucoraja erinacea]|uniref:elongin A, like isoform X3 n=1 Tax=Leucoraja erinaceus TaxID=7782 RepID=UPI002454F74E|nr:elongin A, like isoform X3 [Leucoraja erinacea]
MAEEVMQDVLHLKERLLKVSDPTKILKLLKRLQDLNITVDVLVETGIGKTVNGFRKNQDVGDIAKELVYQWKKLIPQQSSSGEQSKKKGEKHCEHNEKAAGREKASKSTRLSSRAEVPPGNKCARLLNEEESPEKHDGVTTDQQPSVDNPVQLKTNESKSSRQEKKECSHCAKRNSSPEQRFVKCAKSHKDKSTSRTKDKKTVGNDGIMKDQDKRGSSLGISPTSHNDSKGGSNSGKSTRKNGEKKKNKSTDTTKRGNLASKQEKCSEKEEGSLGSNKPQAISREPKESIKGSKMEELSDNGNDEFEKPVMSFDSYMNYEEPNRKARRPHQKKKMSILEKDKWISPTLKEINVCPSPHRKERKSKGNATKRHQCEDDIWTEQANKKIKVDISALLDIPLPKFLPDITEMPFDFPSTSPVKKSAIADVSDKTVEFTGQRLNCKMQVYSGCKTTNMLKMRSLYEQCLRVLQNNIDSIHEVGGVPFEIIEPVFDQCTSEQLWRIEEHNPSFIEQTDHLWMKHCTKDFKGEQPQEYESWRELYLRLYVEREQKLKILTQSISSAHANKPKGRQVKLAYLTTSAKPPRDILRQQGKHGTAWTALQSSSKQRVKSVKSTDCAGSTRGSGSCDGGSVAPSAHSGPDAKRQVKNTSREEDT